jgi:hypothetical protein
MSRIMMETGGAAYLENQSIGDYAMATLSHLLAMFNI